jgi:hypothetical protein
MIDFLSTFMLSDTLMNDNKIRSSVVDTGVSLSMYNKNILNEFLTIKPFNIVDYAYVELDGLDQLNELVQYWGSSLDLG